MKIKIYTKHVYGIPRIYPACETARQFAALTGDKTFSETHLRIIREMGVEVEEVLGVALPVLE